MGSCTVALLVVPCVVGASGCRSPESVLGRTVEAAGEAVRLVRPEADLRGVRGEIWRATTDVEALAKDETDFVTTAEVRRVLDEWGDSLVRLGVVNPHEVRAIGNGLSGSLVLGTPIPSKGLVLVKEEACGSYG